MSDKPHFGNYKDHTWANRTGGASPTVTLSREQVERVLRVLEDASGLLNEHNPCFKGIKTSCPECANLRGELAASIADLKALGL